MRLHYFDNFRAIAIILIVVCHCYALWNIDTPIEIMTANAITGGTALFVFISGFFLHWRFYKRYTYNKFITKKLRAIGIPYLVLSLLYISVYTVCKGYIPVSPPHVTTMPQAEVFILDLLTGNSLPPLWYVPFILIVFALTPLFFKYIELDRRIQWEILALAFLISAFYFWRPQNNADPLISFFTFLPFYLFGILYSLHQEKFDRFLVRGKYFALVLWLVVEAVMAHSGHVGNAYKANPFQYAGLNYMIPQKALLILVLIGFLKTFCNKENKILNTIANYSFGIYFIHYFFVIISGKLSSYLPHGFIGVLIKSTLIIVVSIAVLKFLQKILKEKSRYIVGV